MAVVPRLRTLYRMDEGIAATCSEMCRAHLTHSCDNGRS